MTIKRCYPVLVGASVGENQLVQSGATSVTVQSGHKYYAKIDGTESLGTSTGSAITINDSSKDMVTDLTAKFGTSIADYIYTLEQATAGAGISKLREWGFLRGYQAYNAGSLESVEVTGKVVRGFNAWDEETESGRYNPQTGAKENYPTTIRAKNYIPVLPNTAYYSTFPATITVSNLNFVYYDADKNFISFASNIANPKTTPANAYYMTFYIDAVYGTTYNHDICINLSNPDRNGEYEPYKSITYSLGNDTLRGIFKLDTSNNLYADGDRKESDGTITRRYGVADLGTLNWVKNSTYTGLFNSQIQNRKISTDIPFICSKYARTDSTSVINQNLSIAFSNGSHTIFVHDDAYTDAVTFTTAMSGVMLVYELATPTTEQGDPFTSPQIVYPDGTEEFVTETSVPVGHETKYQL